MATAWGHWHGRRRALRPPVEGPPEPSGKGQPGSSILHDDPHRPGRPRVARAAGALGWDGGHHDTFSATDAPNPGQDGRPSETVFTFAVSRRAGRPHCLARSSGPNDPNGPGPTAPAEPAGSGISYASVPT